MHIQQISTVEVQGERASADLPRRQATKVNCKILQKIPSITKRYPWQKCKESASADLPRRQATPFTFCFAQYKKGTMGKETVEQLKHSADDPKLLGRLTRKLVENLDILKLSDSVADQLSERIASNFKTSDLVDRLLEKYHEEIQAAITEAIIQRLFPVS